MTLDPENKMFAPLPSQPLNALQQEESASSHLEHIAPVPQDAPTRPPLRGTKRWEYLDAEGRLLSIVDRHEEEGGGKYFIPLTLWRDQEGALIWQKKHPPGTRPLYRLDRLARRTSDRVLVVEGEKAADAAADQFPEYAVITSPGGSNAAAKADWSPLDGRDVIVWPDNDESGRAYAAHVTRLATEAGAKSVLTIGVPEHYPDGWDLADGLPEGVNLDDLHSLIAEGSAGSQGSDAGNPLASLDTLTSPSSGESGLHEGSEGSGDVRLPGLRRSADGCIMYKPRKDGEWEFLCTPIEILAATRNADGVEWGRLIRVRDRDGNWHEWAMPMAELAGSGETYRSRLFSMGLELAPGIPAYKALHRLLAAWSPKVHARCVSGLGWQGNLFVLPDRVIGQADDEEDIVLQAGAPLRHGFIVGGTLDNWRDDVAKIAVGNSRLTFSISMAFASPLLSPLEIEGGGFHFRGGSSIGKTTLAQAAGSVCGGGPNGYVSSWRATDNALEGVAALHNDGLLVLDEMSQVDADSAFEVAYLLANGKAKSRMSRDAALRATPTWRLLFLSTGEIGLADKLRESRRNRRAMAGQDVRIIDLAADAGAQLGVFETLHGFERAQELADHIKSAAAAHYGHALRAFLEALVGDPQAIVRAREFIAGFVAEVVPSEADGQVRRVARRFAVVAAAGELARKFGVVRWPEGEAMDAAAKLFREWLAARGGIEAAEIAAGLAAVRQFIESHGTSRFAPWGDPDRVVNQRAGYRRHVDGRISYYVFPETWRNEVLPGYDAGRIARELGRRGMMKVGADGKPQVKERLPDKSERRVYLLLPTLTDDGEATP